MLPDTRMYLPLKDLMLAFLREMKIYFLYIYICKKMCITKYSDQLNANHKRIKIRE